MKETKYIVGYSESSFGEEDFVILSAKNNQEAEEKFIRLHAIREENFTNYIYDRSVNMSFAELFWLADENDAAHFEQCGEIRIGRDEFDERVKNFFRFHDDFASRYLDYYWSDREVQGSENPFPEDMLIYIWHHSDFASLTIVPQMENREQDDFQWDVFISHASEDKETVARPLADRLRKAGVKVWLDKHELKIGDSLSEKIDEGLAKSRFGIVVLSPDFLRKHWTKKELSGFRAREESGQKTILPIWHKIDKAFLIKHSPVLADLLAVNTDDGLDRVTESILSALFATSSYNGLSVARRLIELLEIQPSKTELIDFLKGHLPERIYYPSWWISRLRFESFTLHNHEFDAYAVYIGHGCRLALFIFTECYKNPFRINSEKTTMLEICDEIIHPLSKIRSIQKWLNDSEEEGLQLGKYLLNEYGHGFYKHMLQNRPKYFDDWIPSIEFYIYAGRRSSIDENLESHDTWSKLLRDYPEIVIKSYDT